MNRLIYLLSLVFTSFSEKVYCKWLKLFIKNKEFSIISNNCWGGGIYENLKLEYTSPTVGLFFYAPCYIQFLSNLEKNLKTEINFITISKYEDANRDRKNRNLTYPIGLLGDIEIHFLHFHSEKEAAEKWKRRAKRVKMDRLFIKFCDRDLCTDKEIQLFDELPFESKVFFSAKKRNNIKSLVFLRDYRQESFVGSLYDYPWSYRKQFNIVNWLNKK
jgi:uncharacterized protein (DUF1919 family)